MRAKILYLLPLVLLLLSAPLLAQEGDDGKYTPPVTSPFGKSAKLPAYNGTDDNFRLLLGVSGISLLKGETALAGSWDGRDFGVKLKLGKPFKLNRFDIARFWDENINTVDELVDDRVSLDTEHNLLTGHPKGISAGIGLKVLYDSDASGTSYFEMEYNLLTYKAEFESQSMAASADPAFKSYRNDVTFSFGKSMMIGNGEKVRPYVEEVIGFGLGWEKATKLNTNTSGRYTTSGEMFTFWYPVLYFELNVGLGMMRK